MSSADLQRLINLPHIGSVEDLSDLSHLDKETLLAISAKSYRFYYRFLIPKKSGGFRRIYQPNKNVKAIQAWILRHILDKLSPSVFATAYRRGISIRENVIPHKDNRFFLSLDLENYFPSIKTSRIKRIFESIGYSKEISLFLSRLCTCNGFLPQGGVTSPALANLVSYKLDRRIFGFVKRRGLTFTRYADDITISGNNRSVLNNSKDLIERIVVDEKYKVNESKTRVSGPKAQVKITGLIKSSSEPSFSVGKEKKNHVRSVLFNFVINNRAIDTKYPSLQSILGYLHFIKFVNRSDFDYLWRYYERLIASI